MNNLQVNNQTQANNQPTATRLIFKIITLGCRVNRYESDAISQQLQAYGWEDNALANLPDQACQVFVVNTCGVTGEAARKSRQMIRKCQKLNQASYTVAVGCQVDLAKDTLGAHLGISNNDKNMAGQIIYTAYKQFLEQQGKTYPQKLIQPSQTTCLYSEYGIVRQQNETRAFIKIQDGCQLNCTYCAIPLARGPVRSRPLDTIVKEAEALVANGFKEIVLTGIHISSYGMDWRDSSDHKTLIDVCKQLNDLPSLERLRLGSLEPRLINEKFVAAIIKLPKLTPHFHLSLQSGCDTVLRRMRRRYTTREYSKAIKLLQAAYPNLNLTTDIIAGFPGETEEEHQASKDYIAALGFTHLHVFPFSPREGTLAYSMPHQLDPAVKRARCKELIQLNNQLWLKRAKKEVGQRHEVLLEELATSKELLTQKQLEYYQIPADYVAMTGYSFNYLPVKLFAEAKQFANNSLVQVEIFAYDGDYLLAKLV